MDHSPKQSQSLYQSSQPWILLGLLWLAIFTIRLAAPSNLMNGDQESPSAYVLDVVKNGNWLCQHDLDGDITSKPPLWTWLSAALTLAWGRINLFTLYLPGAAAAFGVMALVFIWGRKIFNVRAALFAAIALVLSSAGSKWMGLARTDGVFAFMTAATAFLAWRAWNRGGGWTWFWLLAAVATLTKGPLGVVLGASGLLACWWERRSGERLPLKGWHWPGIVLFLAIVVGWFWLAYSQEGQPLIDKMLGKELVGHITSRNSHFPGSLIWQPPVFFLGTAAPWSFVSCLGFWRIWKHPAQNSPERRLERFLFCWFMTGLVIFSIAPHQRADLIWPILAPSALIAGRELAWFASRFKAAHVRSATLGVLVIGLAGIQYHYVNMRGSELRNIKTGEVKVLAAQLERVAGMEFPITHVDSPMTFQTYLNTLRPRISADRAVELLRGREAAFVAVQDIATLKAVTQSNEPPMFTLLPVAGDLTNCPVRIVSNRSDFKVTDDFALCFGTIYVRVHGAKLLLASNREFRFAAKDENAAVIVKNESDEPRKIRVSFATDGAGAAQERLLASHEIWNVPLMRKH